MLSLSNLRLFRAAGTTRAGWKHTPACSFAPQHATAPYKRQQQPRAYRTNVNNFHICCVLHRSTITLSAVAKLAVPHYDTSYQTRVARYAAASASAPFSSSTVCTPMCFRPAVYSNTCLNLLTTWKDLRHLSQLHLQFQPSAQSDQPTESELQLEVDWLFDDAVSGYREGGSCGDWRQVSWKMLHMELQSAGRGGVDISEWTVQLRALLEELQHLWRLRLQDRVPFQYLVCCAYWRELVLCVGPGVLIPRPETELMIDLAQRAIQKAPFLADGPWADLGTGSGAIAIGLANMLVKHGKDAAVYACDMSLEALSYAAANCERGAPKGVITLVEGSWLQPLEHCKGQLAGVVSNPPYIPEGDMAGLQVEVGRHEPWTALSGGTGDGIQSLKEIYEGAALFLRPGGFLALETNGREQAFQVAELIKNLTSGTNNAQPAFQDVEVVNDCYGVPRFVTAYKAMTETMGAP